MHSHTNNGIFADGTF